MKFSHYLQRAGTEIASRLTNYSIDSNGLEFPQRCIIASNHSSSLDPVFLNLGFRKKVIFTFARNNYDGLLIPPFLPYVGRIKFPEGYKIDKTLNEAEEHLEQGHTLAIFPEGKVSRKEGVIGEMRKGVFFFSRRLNIPIVPVSIKGAHAVWPWEPNRLFPYRKGTISLNVGDPFYAEGLSSQDMKDRLRNDLQNLYDNSP